MRVVAKTGTAALVAATVCLMFASCASPPTPVPSLASQYEVTSCPAKRPPALAESGVAGASDRIVPISPTGVTVCHYRPLLSESLQSALVIRNTARASAIASFLNHAGKHLMGGVNCPEDDGESVEFYFWDAAVRSDVALDITGCNGSSNGSTFRLGVDPSAAFLKLAGLPAQRDVQASGN